MIRRVDCSAISAIKYLSENFVFYYTLNVRAVLVVEGRCSMDTHLTLISVHVLLYMLLTQLSSVFPSRRLYLLSEGDRTISDQAEHENYSARWGTGRGSGAGSR